MKESLALAHFAWRLPVYWRLFQSQRHRWESHLPFDTVFFDSETHFRGPDLATGHEIFESMAFERSENMEAKGFLKLAKGCSHFVDLGASGGFFSALFAASRESGQILSVEPDPTSFAALQSTRDKNARPGIRWDCDARGAGAEDKSTPVYGTGYGVGIIAPYGQTDAVAAFEMPTVTLESLCMEHSMVPDLIKFDVESMEYEILQQSAGWLQRLRPRLHLELHTPILRSRGLNEGEVLKVLDEIGYRLKDAPNHDLARIRRNVPADKIIRLDLIAP
jgi:FkbM family methyltransferase